MRAKAIEISWHNKSSVWSVCFARGEYRFVTAGNDKVARLWRLDKNVYDLFGSLSRTAIASGEKPSSVALVSRAVEWLCDLDGHSTTVNVARFSPSGLQIATGADRGEILLWDFVRRGHGGDVQSGKALEVWSQSSVLRGHQEDVLDVSWCSDGRRLVSASVDNAVIVWDVTSTKKPLAVVRSRTRIVQGVAIDPSGRLIASLGSDRALVVHSATSFGVVGVAVSSPSESRTHFFSSDTNCRSVFRRLAWSPDGSFLACPSGLPSSPDSSGGRFAVHLFARGKWTAPAFELRGLRELPIAVSFCPRLFELRNPKENLDASTSCFKLPYRMMFAVACVDAVLLYDTESFGRPFARVSGLHYAEITDVSWASDGQALLVSACDGCVSVIALAPDSIGVPLSDDAQPEWISRRISVPKPDESIQVVTPVRTVVPRAKIAPDPSVSKPKACAVVQGQGEIRKDVVMAVEKEPVEGVSKTDAVPVPPSGAKQNANLFKTS